MAIKVILVSLLLRVVASAIVENQRTFSYRIEQQTDDGSFWAVNTEDDAVRYPCTLVPPAFSALSCVDMDGNTIDRNDIDYSNSSSGLMLEESNSSPEGGKQDPSPTEQQQQEPCVATPADFDGPGGILCPPSPVDEQDNSTSASTAINVGSGSGVASNVGSGDTKQVEVLCEQGMMTRLKTIAGLVVVMVVAVFLCFAWSRGCFQSDISSPMEASNDSKSVATDIVKDDEEEHQSNTWTQV